MVSITRLLFLAGLAGLLVPSLPAQPVTAQPGESAAATAPKVVIIGASVSAGFRDGPLFGGKSGNDSVPLLQALRPRLEAQGAELSSVADVGMFRQPVDSGSMQLKRSLRAAPDLVIGIDFLFWFAYGGVPRTEDEATFRKRRLRAGMKMLDEFACPMLIGDLPDMRGAAARILRAAWIPGEDLLAELNEQVIEWAKARPRVRLFPLGAEVKAMKDEGVSLDLQGGAVAAAAGALLQGDRLHATRLGMAYLARRLDVETQAMLPPGHALLGEPWSLDRYVEVAGAGPDLEAILAGQDKQDKQQHAGKQ